MATRPIRCLAAVVALLTLLAPGRSLAAEVPAPPQDYHDAQYVQLTLGFPNQEAGIAAVDGQPDGLTEALPDGVGRRSLAPAVGTDRYFYFTIHDTYIHGGLNKVVMTVTYQDKGLTPIWLEYDSFDSVRPDAKADAAVKKRVPIVTRSNSEAWKTERVTLDDARFENNQPGPADFRIGSTDELVLRSVSVLLVAHEQPKPAIRVSLDGTEVAFDVVPYLDPATSRVLVPMRAIFNALGVTNEHIKWDEAARRVEAVRGQTIMALTIDSPVAFVNYVPMLLDQPAIIRGDRTLVPVRFVSEQFGLKVEWNPDLRLVTLTTLPRASAPPTTTPLPTIPPRPPSVPPKP